MSTSPLLSLHAERGARTAVGPHGETLLTYGDVPAEYAAALEGALVLDRAAAGRLRVSGADATDFLHRITANRVKGLEPGEGAPNLLLDGKGKVQEVFELERLDADDADAPAAYELTTPPGRAESLRAALDMYLFVEDVVLEDVTGSLVPLDVVGARTDEVAAGALAACDPEWLAGMAPGKRWTLTLAVDGDEVPVRAHRRAAVGCPGLRLEVAPGRAAALWDALIAAGALPGGLAIEDILRVEACRARFGVDIDDTVYPQEARLEEAFHLEKGCYIGQEVVAKIDTYGGLNKRLLVLAVDGDDPVPRGTRLERHDADREQWRDLGVVTSWAYSFALDRGAVLAYVKRRHQDPGTRFQLVPPGVEADKQAGPDRPAVLEAEVVALPLRSGSVVPVDPGAGSA